MLCGIRAEVGLVPTVSDPTNASDRRHIVVNMEMLPLCSPHIRAGRNPERAQIIGQKLNDLCENLLDASNLYAQSDESLHAEQQKVAWYLYADIYCFDHDGNLLDCALLSLISALKSTLLPPIIVTKAGEACVASEMTARTIVPHLTHMPSSTTFGMLHSQIIADPNLEEEGIIEGTLNMIYNEKGAMLSLEKPGGNSFLTDEQLKECFKMARSRSSQIADYIDKSVSTYFAKLASNA